MSEVEFTDRYGGKLPCWLTACHDQCEATGCFAAAPALASALTLLLFLLLAVDQLWPVIRSLRSDYPRR